jgi:hypothetical protein
MTPAFLEQLRCAAEAKEQEESDYRRDSRRQLDALATERTRAYRRYNLLKDMAAAAAQHAERPAGIDVQLAVATAESGWSEARAGFADVRERLGPVASVIHAEMHPPTADADAGEAPVDVDADVAEAFAAFEAWYRERFGQDFLDLLGREAPSFQPLVDF